MDAVQRMRKKAKDAGKLESTILSQRPAAKRWRWDYVVHTLMIGGFALIAWPAEYRTSGIMTFVRNHDLRPES